MSEKRELKLKLKKTNKSLFILLPILVLALIVCFYNFVTTQVDIARKNAELSQITDKLEVVENENQMLKRYSTDEFKAEYIESIARDNLDYAQAEERIYYIVPSN